MLRQLLYNVCALAALPPLSGKALPFCELIKLMKNPVRQVLTARQAAQPC
jgi:hypothetical protein